MLVTWIPRASAALHTAEPDMMVGWLGLGGGLRLANEAISTHDKDFVC